ncbi:MAG TPA: HlyD family efflux transporter periplasmic adaptor subunit, partial [Bryobacteraceae bacterium]|nr:HlyD family efflux transporter periplasmic adaptor subunit [Bryobacteraceae bacterium]
INRMKPAAPEVDAATVWPDTVRRGPMLRDVRGIGTLVPEEILFIAAQTDGRVDRIAARPGALVTANTVLLELSNPELELAAQDAEWLMKSAEATYTDLRVRLQSQKLEQQSVAAKVQSDYVQAKLKADLEQRLGDAGLTSEINLKTTKAIADELANRSSIEKQKVEISDESVQAQLAAQRVQIDKLRAAWQLKKAQVEQLIVRAGAQGVLQQLPVEVGQRLIPGAVLAKIAQPSKLKAELKIPETQAKDILLGQTVTVDTRNGIIPGKVSRIDPAVLNGTVTVDVHLEGELPSGARPDLSVDGSVEIERLADVVFVNRPVLGQPHSTISLFKLEADGKEAVRVPVKLGRGSVATIEILEGLKVGDRVLLSDMSAMDGHNRIRLN